MEGGTQFERIKPEYRSSPSMHLGQNIVHRPLQIASVNNDEPTKKLGVWSRPIDTFEDTITGTMKGVTRCKRINRLASNERRDKTTLLETSGVSSETLPRRKSTHIPMEITEIGCEPPIEDESSKIF